MTKVWRQHVQKRWHGHPILSCGVYIDVNGTVTLSGPIFYFHTGRRRGVDFTEYLAAHFLEFTSAHGSHRGAEGGVMAAPPCWSLLFVLQRAVSEDIRRTSDIFHSSLYSRGPWSCWPQPLGSGVSATPCEDTRQEHGPQFKRVAGYDVSRVSFKPERAFSN